MGSNKVVWVLFVADEIEKELDAALTFRDDMVRVERLRGSVLKSAAYPASAEGPRRWIAMRD